MRLSGRTILCFFVILAVMLPAVSFAGVKIELRNGRSITADNCEESAKGYICYKMGGEFELDRREVISIKASSGGDEDSFDTPSQPQESSQPDQDRKTDGNGTPSGKSDSSKAGDREPDARKRFNEIRARKTELYSEREKLVREQQQLGEEHKKLPDWMPEDKFDDFTRRNADFDERMKKYNAEVEALDKEEKKILENQKTK